ncbi:MAG: ribosome biogenesis GTP-binding protein YihA/YsxC [Candidatus Krumholzibacteriia bacterium]
MGRFEDLRFTKSVLKLADCPPEPWPEVAFSGRSNVGKSSMINRITGRRGLAKVSQRPGKTQALNFFRLGDTDAHLVDLPGYGYAKVPKAVQDAWRRFMTDYLERRQQLAGLVQLMDCRHEPTALDRQMVGWLRTTQLPFLLVLTKADKLKRSQRQGAVAQARRALELTAEQPLQLFSSEDGEGRAEVIAWIDQRLAAWRMPEPAPAAPGDASEASANPPLES